jgi:hypothetical protein
LTFSKDGYRSAFFSEGAQDAKKVAESCVMRRRKPARVSHRRPVSEPKRAAERRHMSVALSGKLQIRNVAVSGPTD